MTQPLSHLNDAGEVHMVDVSEKKATVRCARARAFVSMQPETLMLAIDGGAEKGDVLAAARIAGIQAAKRTHELIPLCHPLPLGSVNIKIAPDGPARLKIDAEVKMIAQTGAEMEALVAVSTAALTVYDMLKSREKGMVIGPIGLTHKSGGKSGTLDFEIN